MSFVRSSGSLAAAGIPLGVHKTPANYVFQGSADSLLVVFARMQHMFAKRCAQKSSVCARMFKGRDPNALTRAHSIDSALLVKVFGVSDAKRFDLRGPRRVVFDEAEVLNY